MSEQAQTSLYETELQNPELEKALEARQGIKDERKALNKRWTEADAHAKTLVQGLELGEGAVVRVGRFLVSQKSVPSRAVSFETDPTSRLQISLLPE